MNKEPLFSAARVVQGTVNGQIEWRVYLDGEIVARCEQYKHAIYFRDCLNGKEAFNIFKAGQDSMEEGGKSFDQYFNETFNTKEK